MTKTAIDTWRQDNKTIWKNNFFLLFLIFPNCRLNALYSFAVPETIIKILE